MRRIDWNTPAVTLEKLIAHEAVHEIQGAHEAVHEIQGWDDLRRRLGPDRRCFGFFHPTLPGEPLIFVEVALVKGLATAIQPLLDRNGAAMDRDAPDTAIFYSISNCQEGLRGISFGEFSDQASRRGIADGAAEPQAFCDPFAGSGLLEMAYQAIGG